MNDKELREILHGWDDEKIYFSDKEFGKNICVSDEDELMRRLIEVCREYFEGGSK